MNSMNLLDTIIQNRDQIIHLTKKHGVKQLRLYGSVLTRKETEQSDIDFLAIFDPSLPYEWKATIKLQEELEDYLGRRVSIVDSRRIPEVFRPSIDTDPVDIMELSTDKQYTITPKSSMLYYKMLDRMFRKYDPNRSGYKEGIYCFMAEPLSWWFSRLLRLNDNDLKEFQGFDFVQVLYLCDKLNSITLFDYTNEEMARFIEPVSKVKEYVQLRLEG